MKKIIPYILIFVTILQLFAPFSVGINDGKVGVSKNIASAEIIEKNITHEFIASDTQVKIILKINFDSAILQNVKDNVYTFTITRIEGEKDIEAKVVKMTAIDTNNMSGATLFSNLKPSTNYEFIVTVSKMTTNGQSGAITTDYLIDKLISIPTNPENDTTFVSQGEQTINIETTGSNLPACAIASIGEEKGTFMGCIAQGIYYLFFKVSSFVFGLTGKFLDFTVMYSLSDDSYRSDFIVEGWGLVRDFCNMFFIFVLLYIAFGTILNLHDVKTKEMIISVVIIGIMMNFSLFATRVIIDTSNILARVFYNQQTISVGVKNSDTDKIENNLGDLGEIKLSEAIVSKVNPQRLIINAADVEKIQIKGSVEEGQTDKSTVKTTTGNISTGSFILVSLLATAINIFGMMAFLSCGIIFVSRVIGLWLAMILVPLVFFSYTVPGLQSMKMVGWKHWWPETLKLAFLAPIFTFFMYIIVGFMGKGLDIINADSKTGLNLVIAIVVPFIFIIVLLNKAKDIAKDMSGEIGQKITNGINTIGGVALGAGVGGAALLGRKVIGQTMAKVSRGDTSTQKYEAAKHAMSAAGGHDVSLMRNLSVFDKLKGSVGSKLGLGKVYGQADGTFNSIKGTGDKSIQSGLGGLFNKKQKKIGDIDHARSDEDENMKASGLEGRDRKSLSGPDIQTMEKNFKKTKGGEAEAAARKGIDAKGNEILLDGIKGGESAFKAAKRKEVSDEIMGAPGTPERAAAVLAKNVDNNGPTGKLTKQGENLLTDNLNLKLNAAVKIAVDSKLTGDFTKMRENANKHVNPFERSFSTVNKNSFDLRKLSEMKTDRRESGITKGAIGLAALIATGVRTGIRGSGFGNSKVKVEGDFFKDLGNTISDSLKSMKVNVDLSHVAEHKSSADSHGGGGHH